MPIPYGRQTIDEDDVSAVVEILRGDWLTQGPAVAAFEEAFADACGAPYAVAFSSGTAALHAAALSAGLEPGQELLTSSMTFLASANCGAYAGATPTFADIDPATWNISGETLAAAAGERTRVAVPVHYAGLPLPMEEIRAALGDDVRIVEDACHALGGHYDGEPVGSCAHSDMACFSLHPVKAIAAGEGGMVTTRDPELRERLLLYRNHGMTKDPELLEREDGPWYYEQHLLGFNFRLTDIQSALGHSQLGKLAAFVERRNEVAARYREGLGGIEGVELPPEAPAGSLHAYHLFVIRLRDAEARRGLYDFLREREIFSQVHYYPVHLQPFYRHDYGYEPGLCPEAERHYEGALSLPCFPALTSEEHERVIESVREFTAA
jgi:perosamine synthetase